jgi:hypothetical protein
MNKKAQTSVEYILLLGMVASMIFSLVGFSDHIKQKITMVKAGLRNKLAGSVELSRSDFGSPGVRFAADDDMDGMGGKGIDGKGAGGKDGAGKDGKGKGKGKDQEGAELSGTKRESEGEQGEDGSKAGEDAEGEDSKTIRRFSDDEYYYETDRYGNRVLKKRERKGKEGRRRGEEEDEKSAIAIKENLDESVYYKEPKQEEMNFTFWKILLIVGIVVFFFVVIMKARQGKDD